MNTNDVLLEMCNIKDARIKELEKELSEAHEEQNLLMKQVHALGGFAYKLDEIREDMMEIECGNFSSVEESK
ncbi:MAG: hypothetical protein CMH52_03070 [Myxococcales bacterium]|nr:hypothetical protein [Myxococcales bacterium]|tara:strand:+ start:3061 stop:3276 length:216 start_codon:yes stop_codon:yes gene_type:complete